MSGENTLAKKAIEETFQIFTEMKQDERFKDWSAEEKTEFLGLVVRVYNNRKVDAQLSGIHYGIGCVDSTLTSSL